MLTLFEKEAFKTLFHLFFEYLLSNEYLLYKENSDSYCNEWYVWLSLYMQSYVLINIFTEYQKGLCIVYELLLGIVIVFE